MKKLNSIIMSGKEVLPLVEGGKGISATNGRSTGAWANAGGIGTFSGVNADEFDDNGKPIPIVYHGKTRTERHEELIAVSIKGGINQAIESYEIANGNGCINMNVLWEMGGTVRVLHGILEGAKGLINGVTCGAGMPYKLAEICARYGVYYHPIVSSGRAFRALYKRAFHKFESLLGSVVYEDPWLAGGHNGLSNAEDPLKPEDPYPRVVELRKVMREHNLGHVPIIMAGGVWWLKEWEHWLDNPEIGPIAFQYGTRPLVTQESPIPDEWKQRLLTLKPGDVKLHRFSPTGFYSSAVHNPFLEDLYQRSERQIPYNREPVADHTEELKIGPRGRPIYTTALDKQNAEKWIASGYTMAMRTPDSTLVFVTPESGAQIHQDQVDCMGCLSHCGFSNWKDHDDHTTGKTADPRSFCIQKTLQYIAHEGDVENQLMFAGHNAYRFATDPFYKDGFIPTVKQLMERIQSGE